MVVVAPVAVVVVAAVRAMVVRLPLPLPWPLLADPVREATAGWLGLVGRNF